MKAHRFDLDPESRRALEFDELLDWIAGNTRTPIGAESIRALHPSSDLETVLDELATVEEMRIALREDGAPLPAGLPDPRPALSGLAVTGLLVDSRALRDLAVVMLSASELGRALRALGERRAPRLAAIGARFPPVDPVIRRIVDCVDSEGRILDEASSELRRIRVAAARVAERLRDRLQRMLHSPEARSQIQDDFITERNGRFVIPVRTDSPRAIKGIVHATSSSGATRFVEPLGAVEHNNERVRLAEEEQREQQRIVLAWTDALRDRAGEVDQVLEAIRRVDGLQARALFAEECDAVSPEISRGGDITLREIRHPMLERRLREIDEPCVPLTLELRPADRVLVVSGPNTGGKTVALKTFGLAVLMAQSGIPLAANEARLPLLRQLRADIGDHQSIQADLSTYSAHVRAVVQSLRDASPPAMFLFDEIGSGTEPGEGAALARAILEALQLPGMTTIATTHQGALKTWALADAEVVSAAMEFDTEALRPTYRILMGAAGVSAGLDIAKRYGLDTSIVDRARGHMDPDQRRGEGWLDRLRDLTREAEDRRDEIGRREAEFEQRRVQLEEDARSRDAERAARTTRELEAAVRELRTLAQQGIAEIRDRGERERAQREVDRLGRRLATEQSRAGARLAGALGDAGGDEGIEPADPRPGMRVRVRSLGREGEIREVSGRRVEVQLGRMSFTVDRSDLRVEKGAPQPSKAKPRRKLEPRVAPASDLDAASSEIKLIGMTVDEAEGLLDRFLDRSVLAGLNEVRIVHGHGTGRLRAAVRRFLTEHPHVADHRPGAGREGGDGATIARLR